MPSVDPAATPRRPRRPPASDLGLHRLTFALLIWVSTLAAAAALAFWALGLTLRVGDAALVRGTQAVISLVAWGYYFSYPGRPKEWINAEAAAAFLLGLLLAAVMTPAQYAAAALARPTIDSSLAAADAMLGIHVPDLAAWTRPRPLLRECLRLAYGSLVLQFLLIVPALWLRSDRRALWEFTFSLYFTATLTLLASAIWPVACVFDFYGFESLLPQATFSQHFTALRAGTMTVVDMSHVEGLISMPSFHTAGALIVTWALRRTWWLCVPVALLNAGLIAATVLTGTHYAVDIIAAFVLVLAGIIVYRRIVGPWWTAADRR